MSAEKTSPRIPAIQLCYVRLAVSQPQAAATFATEILGLEHVPNKLEPFLYRSDSRFHTLCLSTAAAKSSIGIEINDEADLDRAAEALASAGLPAPEPTLDEFAHRSSSRTLPATRSTWYCGRLKADAAISPAATPASPDCKVSRCAAVRSTTISSYGLSWAPG
jgi:hypothetical protein